MGAVTPQDSLGNLIQFPSEIHLTFFKKSDVISVGKMARVCKFWRTLSCDNTLWKSLVKRDFPMDLYVDFIDYKVFYKRNYFNFKFANYLSSQPRITDDVLEHAYKRCPLVSYVSIVDVNNCFVTPIGWNNMIKALPNLIHLQIESNSLDETFLQGLKHLKSLEKLSISGRNALENNCLKHFRFLSFNLKIFDLRMFGIQFPINEVALIANAFANLKEFSFHGGVELDDVIVDIIAHRSPHLEILYLHHCSAITILSINILAHKCQNIRMITLIGSTLGTEECAEAIDAWKAIGGFKRLENILIKS